MANQAAMMTIRKDGHIIAVGVGGFTFTPGTYRSVGGIVADAGTIVTLDGLNEANPEFVFQSTTLVFGAGVSVVLTNGARPEHVLWVATSIVTVGADSFLRGSILGGAAIGFGAGTQMQGCVLAQSTVTLGAICYIEFPKIPDVEAPDLVENEGCVACPINTTSILGTTSHENCFIASSSISFVYFTITVFMQIKDFSGRKRKIFIKSISDTLNIPVVDITTLSVIQSSSTQRRRLLEESIDVQTVVVVESRNVESVLAAMANYTIGTHLFYSGFSIDAVTHPVITFEKPTTRILSTAEAYLISLFNKCPCMT
jgi:hypothetical protein